MDNLSTDAIALQLPRAAATTADQILPTAQVDWLNERLASRLVKRSIDIVGSFILLLLLTPLLLVVAWLVARTGRPILFAQERVGLGGRTFRCLKFRTMTPGAQEILDQLLRSDSALKKEWEQGWKLKNDFRITREGAVLRKLSLDELPQLWNVLRGEMSLVGPRPALPEQMPHYGEGARIYCAMRPGITGLWQVTARGDGNIERRVRLDCEYVINFSLYNDLVYLLETVRVVFGRHGAL
jgi:lipopolysaccharide/colanic/teichoic acid biosynthesis glycosyltransferase